MYTFAITNSLTGNRIVEVTSAVAGVRWTTRAHGVGDAEVSLNLRGTDLLSRSEWQSFTEHWSRTLVVSWNDVAVYAGLICGDDWDAPTGVLKLQTVELRNELSWRNVTGVSNYNPAGSLVVSGKSKQGMIAELLKAGLNRGDSSFYWNYPLDVGVAGAGDHSKTYWHYELQNVEELIQEWQNSEGGPDVHLQPEWRSGDLWWAAKYGAPRLAGATFEFSQSAADSPVVGARRKRDGRKITTGTFVAGKGSEQDMRVGLGDPANSSKGLVVSTPYRDRTVAHKQIDDLGQLNSLGLADVETHFRATAAKSFSLRITDDVHPGNLKIGSRVNVWTAGDEYESEGTFAGYLVGLSGGLDGSMGLELVPL